VLRGSADRTGDEGSRRRLPRALADHYRDRYDTRVMLGHSWINAPSGYAVSFAVHRPGRWRRLGVDVALRLRLMAWKSAERGRAGSWRCGASPRTFERHPGRLRPGGRLLQEQRQLQGRLLHAGGDRHPLTGSRRPMRSTRSGCHRTSTRIPSPPAASPARYTSCRWGGRRLLPPVHRSAAARGGSCSRRSSSGGTARLRALLTA